MEVVHVEQLFTQQHLLITIQVHLESLLMQIYLVTSYFLMKLLCQTQTPVGLEGLTLPLPFCSIQWAQIIFGSHLCCERNYFYSMILTKTYFSKNNISIINVSAWAISVYNIYFTLNRIYSSKLVTWNSISFTHICIFIVIL